ncbi:MAG: hypothetical protein JWO48_1991 [Bryobacterales bacterium]|nr:hypothetical protein [Bryobacterales bacterium]
MNRNDETKQADSASQPRRSVLRRLAVLMGVAVMIVVPLQRGFADDGNTGQEGNGANPYAIGLWGDLPYSSVQATVGVPNLIADMNAQNLAFTAHDGDLKSGSSVCTDAVYAQALLYFNSLRAPAVFTPGDNDWVDCDRTAGYSSLAQLDKERSLFFSTPYTLGQKTFRQEVQSTPLCLGVSGSVPCVENRRWTVGRVTYATLNIQGSCNNLCDTAPDPNEYAARNKADIAWMQETFAQAKMKNSSAVMFITQADPGFDQTDGTRGPLRDPRTLVETDGQPDGFQEFLLALRTEVIAYEKPVAYVHGDSHYFRLDKPFLDAQGRRLENFTRIETFGDNQANGNNDVHWLKVLVDPSSREVFAYQPQIVPANRTAVPAP